VSDEASHLIADCIAYRLYSHITALHKVSNIKTALDSLERHINLLN